MEIIYSKSAQLNFHLTWSRKFAIDEQKAQFNIPRLFGICMYACICCCGSFLLRLLATFSFEPYMRTHRKPI